MGLKGSNGPEEILRQQFLGEQKPIGQLETPTEQFGFFARLPEAAQRKLFVDQIDQGPHEDTKAAYDQMLSPWTRGDVKSIAVTFNKDLMTSPELKASLLEQRNANWAKWIEQRLGQPGTILVAVGAGHLAGKDSVIARCCRPKATRSPGFNRAAPPPGSELSTAKCSPFAVFARQSLTG